jgi:hypothetical protein
LAIYLDLHNWLGRIIFQPVGAGVVEEEPEQEPLCYIEEPDERDCV